MSRVGNLECWLQNAVNWPFFVAQFREFKLKIWPAFLWSRLQINVGVLFLSFATKCFWEDGPTFYGSALRILLAHFSEFAKSCFGMFGINQVSFSRESDRLNDKFSKISRLIYIYKIFNRVSLKTAQIKLRISQFYGI